MKNIFSLITKNQSLIYKVFLFVVATFLLIYLLPKGGQFKYNFQKGKPWQYENLYAPFSFSIKKSEETIKQERQDIRDNTVPYFDFDTETINEVKEVFQDKLEMKYVDSLYQTSSRTVERLGQNIIKEIYTKGVSNEILPYDEGKLIYLKRGNEIEELQYSQLFQVKDLNIKVREAV